MDPQTIIVDQFTTTMVSIQEVIDSLNQKLDTQQGIHQSPPPGPSMPHASSFMLHGQSRLAPPVIAQTTVSEDVHALMDHLEQQIRQIRVSDSSVSCDSFDGIPVANLLAKFRIPDTDRYTGISCHRIHLRLYSNIIRAYGLDET